ncbi:titin homolog isoform X1 [Dicentrarchus labrax]|uniref:titin homolog isoform X1 n=1 Tax=Dicentrarchus labrax TaxID=13489 RepID=UPI0021F521BA|nr:titin homolog isoform X1 [Dicentrarchus labrax]
MHPFAVYEQGDAAECLELILNKISQQDSKEIQGHLMYTTKCSEGHIINKETSLFWTLPLSLPLSLKDNHDTTYSVERSFERIFQTKIFNGDNKVHCNECNYKTEATKECEMEKYPPILTVLLKRFDFDYRRMSHFKSDCCVDVPLELKRKNQTYKLYGMVKHMGSLTGGHYTATILSDEDETWYECSDTYVRKVEQLFEKETYKSRTVYLLMYRECQKPAETNSEDLTDKVKEEQGEDIGLEEQKGEELENENVSKRDTDDEENTQIGHSEEDDGQMGKDQEKDTLSLQAGGEEGDEESVKKDTSVRETSYYRNTNSDEDCEKQKLLNSEDEEVQENLKSIDDAPVNVGKQKRSSKKTNTVKQKQRAIQPQRVHYGLHNQGATCYLNSVLQVLFMTPEVHDRFHSELETELNRVFAGLKKRTCGTENITRILKIKNVYEQGDAAECLELILNKISQQDSKEIQGRLMYTTKCSEGHIINKETSLFWTLPLSLPLSLKDNHDTTYSVERSFERIFQTKIFNGDNKVHCNECNYKTEATKECEMEKYPPILTVLLKRFDFDYRRMSHFKSDCCVDVPLELKRKNQTYKLYGMVKHMGSLTGGHYTATILSDEDETWYECSDTYVRKVEQLFEKETYKSRTVYLLMYRVCQKPAETNSEDLTDKVKEEQGEDIGLEEQKGEELENKNVSKRDTDDEENTQIGHSEEDDGQMGKDQEKDTLSLQAGGEEGDEESVKKDTSVRETSYYRNTNSDEDCEKQKLLNSEDEEVQENLKSMGSTFDGKSANQSYSMKSSGDHDDSRFNCSAEEKETQCILQVRGEQGEKKDTSDRETINDRNNNTGVKCATLSKVKTSGDKEVQDNGFINEDSSHSSSTEENTNEKSEELKETKVDDAPVNVEEQVKHSSDQHLDKETKTEKQKQTECQKPVETNSEDLTDKVKEEQGEVIGLEEQKGEELENKNVCKRDTDDEDNTQMGHSEEDEGQMRKDQEKHALSLQARGEEGDEESVKKDTSVRETINDRHMSTDEDCEKQNKLINSEDEVVQETLFVNEDNTHSSSTEENTNDKSEELKETKVDDAPVNVGEQLNNSSEQHLNEETKTEKQKQTECQKPAETNSEDLTDKVKEEQGEDIGLEEQKGEELENKNVSKRDTDDEENTQIGHSEEDDGQMGKDQEKDTLSLQAGGEEGDEESVKKDTSVRETSYYRNTNSDKDCEKQKLLNSEDEEVQENLKSMGSTFDGKSANQSYSMKSSGDHDDSRFNCSAEENETQCILQVRGEQGEKKDTSDRETINDRNINTGVKCATLSKVKTSGDKEVQDNGFINEDSSHSSSTEENTNEKSEELKETKVDDAPVNVEEQVKYSSDQHLDEETKTERQKQTECQKPAETSSEDLKDEVKEEQGEDIGLEEQKGEEGENNNVSKRDTDDEDNTQMGHSEEDALGLQARGEEGDAESIKKDTSVRETSCYRNTKSDEDREKQKLLNSEDEIQENLNSMGSTHGGKSVSQGETERGSPCCNIWSSLPNFLCFKRSSTAET